VKNLGFLCIFIAFGCQTFKEPPLTSGVGPTVNEKIDTSALPEGLHSRASVKNFYSLQEFSPFWTTGPRLNTGADSLLDFIEQADQLGLEPSEYHVDDLHRLLRDTLVTERLNKIDVLLTDAYLTLYSHLRFGRIDPGTFQRRDYSRILSAEAVTSLQKVQPGAPARSLTMLEPHIRQYLELKNALRSFQLLGRDDSVQRNRAVQISLNLERWRLKKKLPERYVSVNIPAFMLQAVEKDSVWLETKVIVGKRDTPTPLIESVIKSFIIYPYWHVPNSIATKEILPHLQTDASYLARNNFDVLDKNGRVILPDTIQWDFYRPDFFPFILRQREGSENSMGIIKFNFLNNYGVYLHDTNSKRLFEREGRDLSHGCVRVKNAVAFAHYLVREDDIYVSPEDLDQYLSLQQRLKIDLRKPIPLRLEYFTAEVRNGTAFFYEDIYKKDSVMLQVLYPMLAKPRPNKHSSEL
jgi:L,D-transpeptidase YcbB